VPSNSSNSDVREKLNETLFDMCDLKSLKTLLRSRMQEALQYSISLA